MTGLKCFVSFLLEGKIVGTAQKYVVCDLKV